MPTIEQARLWYSEGDPVHGFDHVLRVYRLAEELAIAEGADLEVVCAAALLHDAREVLGDKNNTDADQRANHHHHSADLAARTLAREGWSQEKIAAVRHCIQAHRYRDNSTQPETLEAKILFDADKLDAIGAIGVARAIAYAVQAGQPFFSQPSQEFLESGRLQTGEPHSAYHEYVYKLVKIKELLCTPTARRMADVRQRRMVDFFEGLSRELTGTDNPS